MSAQKPTVDRIWLQSGFLILAFAVPTVAALLFEERTFNEINVWIKPLKFQASTALHLFTLYIVAQLMQAADRRKPVFGFLVWASALASLFEIVIITWRAAQARASHFNYETPTDALIYALMGLGAVTMLLPAIYLGFRFLRSAREFEGGSGLKRGIATGFLFGSLLTLLFAGYMSSSGGHWTSGQVSDAGGLVITGWSRSGGDLRVAHFFATHLLQILPLTGLLADRLLGAKNAAARWPVYVVLFLVAGTSIATFVQALNGHPFLS